jgi:hypothetical protein
MAWDLTRNKIISRALRLIGAVPQGDSPFADQLADGSDALNSLMKSFNVGTKLWKVRTYSLQLNDTDSVIGSDGYIYDCLRGHTSSSDTQPITGNEYQSLWNKTDTNYNAWATGTDYEIGDQIYVDYTGYKVYTCTAAHTAGATFAGDIANWDQDTTYDTWVTDTAYTSIGDVLLPVETLSVLKVWYKETESGNEYPIELISGLDFERLIDKNDTASTPDFAWVDKQIRQRLFFRDLPENKTYFELMINAEEVIDDLVLPGANPDMFSAYYDMLTFGLALRLAPEYGLTYRDKEDLRKELAGMVQQYMSTNKEDVDNEFIEPAF